MKRVILVTEYLNPPYDEGIKKTVYNLYLELEKKYKLEVICRFGFEKDCIHIVDSNRLFLSKKVRSIINSFRPDTIIYLPFQSSTFASYLRLSMLNSYAQGSRSVFIALQPKSLKKWQEKMVTVIKPEFALTPSPVLKQFWDRIQVSNQLIPLLTDLSIFKPLESVADKTVLRKKYGLPIDAYIISHMGHLNEGRNLRSLIPLQEAGYQVVIVGSSSTPLDAFGEESLKSNLLKAGIIIIDQFIEHIEEIYQLSDLYIFPVVKKNSSIGLPLSVLEARACGIPVLTTDYGSVRAFMDTDFFGILYSKPDNFLNSVMKTVENRKKRFDQSNVEQLNNKFYKTIHQIIEN